MAEKLPSEVAAGLTLGDWHYDMEAPACMLFINDRHQADLWLTLNDVRALHNRCKQLLEQFSENPPRQRKK